MFYFKPYTQRIYTRLFFAAVLAAVLGFAPLANANSLVDNGGGFIYDPDFNITWYDYTYQSSPGFGVTWQEASAWASGLTVGGVSGWRLPSALNLDGSGPCFGWYCVGSEMGHLYYTELGLTAGKVFGFPISNEYPFHNILSTEFWTGTEFAFPGSGFYYNFTAYGFTGGYGMGTLFSALAVHEGNIAIAPIPEPETYAMLLAGLGLIGFMTLRKNQSFSA